MLAHGLAHGLEVRQAHFLVLAGDDDSVRAAAHRVAPKLPSAAAIIAAIPRMKPRRSKVFPSFRGSFIGYGIFIFDIAKAPVTK